VSPEELAAYLSMSTDWCYRHAAELGARKCGNKLRFSIPEIDERLRVAQPGASDPTSCSSSMGSPQQAAASQRVSGAGAGEPLPKQRRRLPKRADLSSPNTAESSAGPHDFAATSCFADGCPNAFLNVAEVRPGASAQCSI